MTTRKPLRAPALAALALALAFEAALPNAGTASQPLRISGDPCTIPLAEKLSRAFSKKTGVKVALDSGKCRSGVASLLAGNAEIGLATFNFEENRLEKSLNNHVIGKAPIVMVVNKANPVADLSQEQLKGVLSGRIRNWSRVGGKDLEIKNVMLMPCVVETMSYQAGPYGRDVRKLVPEKPGDPVAGTNALVEKDEAALGMQIYGHESPDVKVLTIDGLLPDAKNVPGKYGLYENYNVVTRGEPSGDVKAFLEFARGAEGREIMKSMRHIPLKD